MVARADTADVVVTVVGAGLEEDVVAGCIGVAEDVAIGDAVGHEPLAEDAEDIGDVVGPEPLVVDAEDADEQKPVVEEVEEQNPVVDAVVEHDARHVYQVGGNPGPDQSTHIPVSPSGPAAGRPPACHHDCQSSHWLRVHHGDSCTPRASTERT